MENFTFQDIYDQNHRRIHYHIHQLNIKDPHQEYYSEGLTALWQAYKSYDRDKGPMSTYFNFIIRNRLIDFIRKRSQEHSKRVSFLEEYPVFHEPAFYSLEEMVFEYKNPYEKLKSHLTENQ
ncbi:sigma factor [Virgibacillus indicus]|uniref:sigma factor n=1 Tax=Virgibacillus indicus TaxID=2024554 RepID=UPI001F0B1EFE|nr:sigma factor [Virgibacillus indicus]